MRLWVRDTIDALDVQIADLQLALAEKARDYASAVMPGFTHLQSAQPVTFGHHCLAYVEMLGRDRGRLRDARTRLNECPARRRRARRHLLPHRSRDDPRRRLRLRPPHRQFGLRLGLSDRDFASSAPAGQPICACISPASRKTTLWMTHPVSLHQLLRPLHRLSNHAAEKNPGRRDLVRG